MYWPKVFASLNNLLAAFLSTACQHPTFQEPSEPLIPRIQKVCLELAATNPFPCVRIEGIASLLPYAMKCDAWIVIHADYGQLMYVSFCKTDLQSALICIWESLTHDYMHRANSLVRTDRLLQCLRLIRCLDCFYQDYGMLCLASSICWIASPEFTGGTSKRARGCGKPARGAC